jgi:hypothetical protein
MRLSPFLSFWLPLLSLGCATTGPQVGEEPMETDWIVGSWRVDSYIQAGTQRREILFQLTFLPTGLVNVIDQNTGSKMASQCRWYARVNWIDTSCRGIDIRIIHDDAGPLDVELAGTVRVPYYTEECGRWGVDANGNPICLRWDQVERFRNVQARGQGILEPFRARD